MQLLLLRHGLAEDVGPDSSDDTRRLTDEGIRNAIAVTDALARFADKPELILTSPKTRAVQTAEIAGQAFGAPVQVLDLLGANSPDSIISDLPFRKESRLMLVGHEPSFGATAERLCHNTWEGYMPLKPAGCICLEVFCDPDTDSIAAQLLWMTTPKMLLALSGEN